MQTLCSYARPTLQRLQELKRLNRCQFHCDPKLVAGKDAYRPIRFGVDEASPADVTAATEATETRIATLPSLWTGNIYLTQLCNSSCFKF